VAPKIIQKIHCGTVERTLRIPALERVQRKARPLLNYGWIAAKVVKKSLLWGPSVQRRRSEHCIKQIVGATSRLQRTKIVQ
jgi:hypothetical protein